MPSLTARESPLEKGQGHRPEIVDRQSDFEAMDVCRLYRRLMFGATRCKTLIQKDASALAAPTRFPS